MIARIQLRNDTASAWTLANPVLAQGEMGIESDTLKQKIGDGSSDWITLGYSAQPTTDADLQTLEKTVTGAINELNSDKADLVNGKVPLSQMDDSLVGAVEYKETWDANTNTPTLPSTPTEKGIYYVVNVAGTQFGLTFGVGDWIISNGTIWQKLDNSITKEEIGLGNVDNTSDLTKMTVSIFSGLNTVDKTIVGAINEVNSDLGDHIEDIANPHAVTKTQVGLSNVDNTSDVTKMTASTFSGLNTTDKTIVGAINELNANISPISPIDTGAIMGVKFIDNGAGFNAERYGLAKGKTFSYSTNGNTTTINSDFDTMPIYKYMRRGIFDNNGVLIHDQDAVSYDDTLSTGGLAPHTHWVGVYIPKFYFRINVTFSPNYVMDIAVSDKAFDGSLVHPVFTQHSNTGA